MKRKHPGRQRRLDESKVEMRKAAAVKVLGELNETPLQRALRELAEGGTTAADVKKFQDAWNADEFSEDP